VLVTAITPTPAGEGKTTTTVGLSDALNRTGRRTVACLREPSLGPCFGTKGGAAGGGRAQVMPMERINLHFTGDIHAVGAAHNLLAALVDNHLHWGNALGIDATTVTWRRVIDVNDRALRRVVTGLGDPNGPPREDGFDITVASEVMAVLCLARDLDDLQRRLAGMVVARDRGGRPVTCGDLGAAGALAALLRDAFAPNLVQTLEHNPALVHGGPFANIAHGCSSLVATRRALGLADYVVTEAGFGADLGAEKFFDIKCRQGGLRPDVAVLVATVRALEHHGGADTTAPGATADPLGRGLANLERHVANLRHFGVSVVVALNHFEGDDPAQHARVLAHCRERLGVPAQLCDHFAAGGEGALDLAETVAALADGPTAGFRPLYSDGVGLWAKLEMVACTVYGAGGCEATPTARRRLAEYEDLGYGMLPVCVAKTPYSFSADPTRLGAPGGHVLPVRDARLCAGAGFVVALCGDVTTMPGLPRRPAAERIGLDADGRIHGLF
jgi:formate--tetrahydrofolate ligase